MKKLSLAAVALLLPALSLFAWGPFGPKVKFAHVTPAPYHMPGVAKIVVAQYSTWDPLGSESMMQSVIWRAKEQQIEVIDGTDQRVRFADLRSGGDAGEKFRNAKPADAYMSIDVRNCDSRINSEIVTKKKKGGDEKVTEYWGVATCSADFRIIDGADGRELAAFSVVGDGTSTRSETRASYLESTALSYAISEAANEAVAKFAPRHHQVSIGLEKSAPAFKEGFERVKRNQLEEARKIWEAALDANAGSAPLHFNLAAVDEALGDHEAAGERFRKAAELSAEKKYQRGLRDFEERTRDREKMAETR